MARITVDDCIKFLPNRFELTLAATNRARQIALGATPMVEPNKDKPTVIALREIAAGKVGKEGGMEQVVLLRVFNGKGVDGDHLDRLLVDVAEAAHGADRHGAAGVAVVDRERR
mgnify:CR=1 FL=1